MPSGLMSAPENAANSTLTLHVQKQPLFSRACAPQGLDQWVSLTLDEPIICNDQEIECAVIVNISNSHPNIVSVEPCYVRWHRDEWHHTKRVRVSLSPSLPSSPQQTHSPAASAETPE